MKGFLKFLAITIVVVFIGFSLWTWASLNYVYSSGERAGYVQKLSKKGWICKTWEGELAMVSLPGTAPEIFLFTVPDDQVADHINQSLGRRVKLTYEQHLGIPLSCFGETGYFITGVQLVE